MRRVIAAGRRNCATRVRILRTLDHVRQLKPAVREAALRAGAIALGYFRPDRQTSARIWAKSGGSPVTEADVSVDAFLKIRLSEILPQAAWLSEETADNPARMTSELVWVVDPIDGTRAFLAGDSQWAVAIALLHEGRPVYGIVHAPALGETYEALEGDGATLEGAPIAVSPGDGAGRMRAMGPKPLIRELPLDQANLDILPRVPSLALRVAFVAAGRAEIGAITAKARDWDIAASEIILREAGGELADLGGVPTRYNLPNPVHGPLIAAPERLHRSLIEAMRARQRLPAQPVGARAGQHGTTHDG